MNFYNDNDRFAAAWLRELIAAGLIPAGVVSEKSICEIQAEELKEFTQCHFFAGIGGWSLALRLAGWPDDEPCWTGSCPCQPLSCAGQRKGHADERHLWPAFHALIAQRRPATVFGEQVASSSGMEWLSGVRADLEASGYAVGIAIIPACGVGAPHRRDRQWFVANTEWHEQSRKESRKRSIRRMGQQQQLFPWNGIWRPALAKFRVVDNGLPRCVAATDAARNAIVPQVAAQFIKAFLEIEAG